MLVFVYPEKVREELGAVRWQVTWHTLREGWTPAYEDETPDPDCDVVYHHRSYTAEADAVKAATDLVDSDYFGCPIVQRQVVDWYVEEDRVAEWSDAGEPVYVG